MSESISKRNNIDTENEKVTDEGTTFLSTRVGLTKQQIFDKNRKKMLDALKWLGGKIESLAWIALSIVIIYYSNFFKVILVNEHVNQFFLHIAVLSLGVHVVMNLYAGFILPIIYHINEDIDKYNPRIVYVGAFSGFTCFVCLVIAVWPVWGFLTIPMLMGMFFGYINTGAFLPGSHVGSVLFALIFVVGLFSGMLISHEGYLH